VTSLEQAFEPVAAMGVASNNCFDVLVQILNLVRENLHQSA